MVNIREATINDQAEVFNLLRQLITSTLPESPINQPGAIETFRKIVEDEQGTILVAEEDGQMLGLVTLSYPVAIRCGGSYSCIEEFIVTEQARGKGVGSKLLKAAIRKAAENGSYELQVNHPSDIGYPVYIQQGWKDLGKHLNLYPSRATTKR